MKKRIITNQIINVFKKNLIENEKATATIEKYKRGKRFDYRMLRCTSREPRHADA